jgi:hypothetical protein
VSHFIQFWEDVIVINNSSVFESEIELDELCGLFKKWINGKPDANFFARSTNEDDVLKMLKHYFPNIEVIENKYILNVECKLWNKIADIKNALDSIKNYYKENTLLNNSNVFLIPFDEIYAYYIKNKQTKFTISKRYFEKYLCIELTDYIEFDNLVSFSWILS